MEWGMGCPHPAPTPAPPPPNGPVMHFFYPSSRISTGEMMESEFQMVGRPRQRFRGQTGQAVFQVK